MILSTASGRVQEHAPVLSPRGDAAAFAHAGAPADVPESRRRELRGIVFNSRSNAPWPAPAIEAIRLLRVDDSTQHEVLAPFDTTLGWVRFSPDGSYLSYAVVRDTGIEQWVLDTTSGVPRPLTSASLNATLGEPCSWLLDSTGMLCRFVQAARGSPPDEAAEDVLVDYHFTSQLGTVMLATGRRTDVGSPGLYTRAAATADGYVVTRLGQSVEVWDPEGQVLRARDATRR